MDLELKELADHVGARLESDPDVGIVAPAATGAGERGGRDRGRRGGRDE